MKNKFAIVLTLTLFLPYQHGFSQDARDIGQVLEMLPANWELKEEKPISYQVTTTHYRILFSWISDSMTGCVLKFLRIMHSMFR